MTTPFYNAKTCFLEWSPACGADDVCYFVAQIPLLEIDVCVCRDTSGQTWAAQVNGDIMADEIATAGQAQIIAVGTVIEFIAWMIGDPAKKASDEKQAKARAWMQSLRSQTVPSDGWTLESEAIERYRLVDDAPIDSPEAKP